MPGLRARVDRQLSDLREHPRVRQFLPSWNRVVHYELVDRSAALTYYGLLGIIPTLLAFYALLGLLGADDALHDAFDVFGGLAPSGNGPAREKIAGLLQHQANSIPLLGLGILGVPWTASAYVGSFFRASATIWAVRRRPLWQAWPGRVAVTFVLLILVVMAAIAVVVTGELAQSVGDLLGLTQATVALYEVVKWPAVVLLLVIVVATLYGTSPHPVDRVRLWRFITPGVVFSVVAWLIVSGLFTIYVQLFGSYTTMYGALGTTIASMVWLWQTNLMLLSGLTVDAGAVRVGGRRLSPRRRRPLPYAPNFCPWASHGGLLAFLPITVACPSLRRSQLVDATRSWPPLIDAVLRDPDRVDVHFQPIVDLRRGVLAGYEVLARFRSDPYLSPDQWFDAAARIGRRAELEAVTLGRALDARRCLPPNCFLSMNVGPDALLDDRVMATLRDAGPLGGVVVEITEQSAVDDYDRLRGRIDPLREAGAHLAVDDAGAGYASLSHVAALRPDFIKVDRGLVAGIDRDPAKAAVMETLGTFGSRIDAWVIAEGIERAAELRRLMQLEVPLGQGYRLGRPAPDMRELDGEVLDLHQRIERVTGDGLAHLVEPVAAARLADRGRCAAGGRRRHRRRRRGGRLRPAVRAARARRLRARRAREARAAGRHGRGPARRRGPPRHDARRRGPLRSRRRHRRHRQARRDRAGRAPRRGARHASGLALLDVGAHRVDQLGRDIVQAVVVTGVDGDLLEDAVVVVGVEHGRAAGHHGAAGEFLHDPCVGARRRS